MKDQSTLIHLEYESDTTTPSSPPLKRQRARSPAMNSGKRLLRRAGILQASRLASVPLRDRALSYVSSMSITAHG